MSPECERFLPLLHDWLEGIADEESALLAQWHWKQCPQCQQVVAEWQTLAWELKVALQAVAPPSLEARIAQHLQVPRLISWQELTATWLLTSSGVAFALFWFGFSLAEVLRSFSLWALGLVSWVVVPVEWIQQAWELVRQWV